MAIIQFEAGSFSLRLGHGAALTCPRHVIHYRTYTSLPPHTPPAAYWILLAASIFHSSLTVCKKASCSGSLFCALWSFALRCGIRKIRREVFNFFGKRLEFVYINDQHSHAVPHFRVNFAVIIGESSKVHQLKQRRERQLCLAEFSSM